MGCSEKENNQIKQKIYGERKVSEIFDFLKPEGKVLDIGTGQGLHALFMAGKGLWVVAMDKDISALKKIGLANLVCAEAEHFPFRAGVFDNCLCIDVLEHLSQPEKCIAEACRVLKPQGKACFTTPCLNLPLRKIVPLYRKLLRVEFEGGRHWHIFKTVVLLGMLQRYFSVEKIRYRDFTIILKRTFNRGEVFDLWLSGVAERLPFLRFFAGANFIKVEKDKPI